MSSPPQRLDSLSKKSTPTPNKPSLKFKPKVVARRTKQERDLDAPVSVKESDRSRPARGRGSHRARGGRPDRFAGTHVVTAGPLADGFVTMNSAQSSTRSLDSRSATPDFINKLRSKNESSKASSVGASGDSSDDDFVVNDTAKINMSKAYLLDREETSLFPVRAARVDQVDEKVKYHEVKEENSRDSSVKPEPLEGSVPPLSSILPELDENDQESKRVQDDHSAISQAISLMNLQDAQGDTNMDSAKGCLFLQLPNYLPHLANEGGKELATPAQLYENGVSGEIGALQVHKSGKISIKLSDIAMDVSRGGSCQFFQEVVALKPKTESEDQEQTEQVQQAQFYQLLPVQEKITVTPNLISLLEE